MSFYKRENYLRKIRGFYDDAGLIKVISGVRRCGKSSLMATIAEELRERGVDEAHIVYLDLDRRPFRGVKTPDRLEAIVDERTPASGLTYLFIDEVQNVEGFEEVVNAFREEGRHSIFLTGSNAYLLSGELATKLTGRYLEFEMFPLTFEEYLGMKAFLGKPVSADLVAEFDRYLREGGFPKAVEYDSAEDRRTYVEGVVAEIFEKDIRRRAKIRHVSVFRKVQAYLVNNFGATTSISSLQTALVKNGLNITRATVSKYIAVLVNAKILYECDRFDMKSKRALKGEKKYYLSDLSFYFCDNTDNRINYGPVLENISFFYARSRGYSVSVGRIGTLECDFILRNRDADYAYLQVAYTIAQSKETEDREYRPLEKIGDNYPKYLLTTDYLLQKRSGIRHVNLMEFMKAGSEF